METYVVTAEYNYDNSKSVDSVWLDKDEVIKYVNEMNKIESKDIPRFRTRYSYEAFVARGQKGEQNICQNK